MASKRQRGDKWEFTFKKAGLLEKPLYLTFDSEEDGDKYARKLEALLDRGIVPTEHQVQTRVVTISDLVRKYRAEAHVNEKDVDVLDTVLAQVGTTALTSINSEWVDAWVTRMKREQRLAPSTIRSKIGALGRCTDWGMRKGLLLMPDHPLRTLPDGYSQYTKTDVALAGVEKTDTERDRRLEAGEHERILTVIEGGVLARKQRPFIIENIESVRCLYTVALESAMRLREIYTLTPDQVDLKRVTVFLDKTKNGDKRQVPLSTVAVAAFEQHGLDGARVFPWWDGDTSKSALKECSNYLSKLYRDIFFDAQCPGLHFHDLRHEATSRLFERTTMTEFEIAKITGHRSMRMLARYANLRGSNLAAKMW